jgi:hypothetical protein
VALEAVMFRALALLLLAAAAPRSCGDGGSSSDGAAGEAAKPSPVAECQTYAGTWCNKAFGCYVQVGRIDQDTAQTDIDACVQQIEDRLPCTDVTDVSDSYDQCISQINGMACSRWDVPQTQFGTVTPPASCTDALVF